MTQRQQRIYDFLQATPVAVLSTVDPNGNPHGVVIYFSIDEDFIVYLLTRAETKKSDNMRHNQHVMLTVFDSEKLATAQIIGRAQEITSRTEINKVAAAIFERSHQIHDGGRMPVTKLDAGPYTAFKIDPAQIRLSVYSRGGAGEKPAVFESVESFDLQLF